MQSTPWRLRRMDRWSSRLAKSLATSAAEETVWRISPEFAPPPRPWVSPSTALTVIGPDTDLTCPRPTGTTSLSSLTLNDSGRLV